MPDFEWKDKNYSFFAHEQCEFFPCHTGVPREDFSCLFCYCPLYFSGSDCGGCFTYTKDGIKDCSDCRIPHRRENYGYIVDKFAELSVRLKKE